jgi:hypothetical protein
MSAYKGSGPPSTGGIPVKGNNVNLEEIAKEKRAMRTISKLSRT